jgi:anti-sigma-K factor RskA
MAMNTADQNEPGDIELLLPWHAAGTLSHHDARRVEEALASDPELARRYELVREEFGQTIHLNESLGAPSARAMAALFERIDAEPRRAPALSTQFGARLREFFASLSPRTLAWSASAAALAIVLQAAVIGGVVYKENGAPGAASYKTASAPVEPSVEGEGSYALIRFQPQASAAEVANFLESNGLNVSAGPSAGGLYRVRVAEKKLPQADVAMIVKKLQDAKVVGFIAPTE